MTNRPVRHVLLVDDHLFTCRDLRAAFLAHHSDPEAAFEFEVDMATTIAEAIEKVRARESSNQFHVIVLDLSFHSPGVDREGLRIADALGLCLRLGQTIPVEIIFSGYADVKNCVQAMRHGAWDVIDKAEDSDGDPYDRVVVSAVSRLKALDLQEHLATVAVEYLQTRIASLQRTYGGRLVAIWHEPEVGVIADGRDVFDLENNLHSWREIHPGGTYPFITRIPATSGSGRSGGTQ